MSTSRRGDRAGHSLGQRRPAWRRRSFYKHICCDVLSRPEDLQTSGTDGQRYLIDLSGPVFTNIIVGDQHTTATESASIKRLFLFTVIEKISRPYHMSFERVRMVLSNIASNASAQVREEVQAPSDLHIPEVNELLLDCGRRCIALSSELRCRQFLDGHRSFPWLYVGRLHLPAQALCRGTCPPTASMIENNRNQWTEEG